ncbi:MAG: hypothetical protein WBO49_03260 [Candidatus Saccharimonas sp.]
MKSLRVFDGHLRYAVLAVTLVLAAVAPAFASAAQLTERSAELSSSSKDATGVSYAFTFTADNTSAGALVVDFCSDSPLVGETCAVPTGFNVSTSGNVTGAGASKLGTWTANKAMVTLAVASGTNTFTITGVHNPSSAGTIYARIVTYNNGTNAQAYVSNNLGSGVVDQGSVALAITDSIGVSGAVLETMTFCAASVAITANCANASGNLPNLTLGEGTPKALTSASLSTGDVYTQLSTNAASGAVVRIKSGNANCSGLALNGDCTNQIAAAGTTGTFTAGTAKFGVYVNPTIGSTTGTGTIALTSGDATVTGTSTAWVATPTVKPGDTIWTNGGKAYTVLSITDDTHLELTANASASESTAAYTYGFGAYRVYNGGSGTYSDTANTYRFDETNIKSAYGDAILDTNSGVVNGGNIKLTFGASISNVTPAGKYSNAYSLIATGKF